MYEFSNFIENEEDALSFIDRIFRENGFITWKLWATHFPFDLAAKNFDEYYLIDVKLCRARCGKRNFKEDSLRKGGNVEISIPFAWPDRARYVLRKLYEDHDLEVNGLIIFVMITDVKIRFSSLWLPLLQSSGGSRSYTEFSAIDKWHRWEIGTKIGLDEKIEKIAKIFQKFSNLIILIYVKQKIQQK